MSFTILLLILTYQTQQKLAHSTEITGVENTHQQLKSELIYDVTKAVREKLNSDSDFFLNNTIEDLGIHLSSQIIFAKPFQINQSVESYDYWNLGKLYQDNNTFSVSYIITLDVFNDAVRGQCNSTCLPLGTFYGIGTVNVNCSKACPSQNYLNYIQNNLASGYDRNLYTMGSEYTHDYLEHCSYLNTELIRLQNFAILKIEFHPNIILFSYPLFRDKLNRDLQLNSNFLQKLNPKLLSQCTVTEQEINACQIYLRANLDTWESENENYKSMLRALVANYVERINGSYQPYNFILDSFPTNTSTDIFHYNDKNKSKNLQLYYDIEDSLFHLHDQCEFYNIMEVANVNINNVALVINSNVDYVDFECKQSEMATGFSSKNKSEYPSVSLTFTWTSLNESSNLLKVVDSANQVFNIVVVYVSFCNQTDINYKSENTGNSCDSMQCNVLKELNAKNISTGCFYNRTTDLDHDSEIESILKICDSVFDTSAKIFLHLRTTVLLNKYDDLLKSLETNLRIRKILQEKYPYKQVDLMLSVKTNFITYQSNNSYVQEPRLRRNFYRTPYLLSEHEFNEIIINWCLVHNISTASLPLLDNESQVGWWYNIETSKELNRASTKFPVLVRRNIPISLGTFAETFSYIEYTQKPVNAIKLSENMLVGMALDLTYFQSLTNVPASSSELHLLLLVILEKFSFVQIDLAQISLQVVMESLTTSFVEIIEDGRKNVEKVYVYLQANYFPTNRNELNWLVKDMKKVQLRFHVSHWGNFTDSDNERTITELSKIRQANPLFQFGLTVYNCIHEANIQLVSLRKFPLIKHVDFIVCMEPELTPNNTDKYQMQLYLDTHFYLKQFYHTKLNVTLIFRPNLQIPYCRATSQEEIEKYLTFLNDVNQYSSAYGVRYLLGSAFEFWGKHYSNCLWGWWNVSGDPKDFDSYVEQEAAYFGRPTNIFLARLGSYKHFDSSQPLILIGAGVAAAIPLSVYLIFILYRCIRRKPKYKILTKDEVRTFRQYTEVLVNEELVGEDQLNVSTVKTLSFNPKFEIPLESIKLERVIGRGNFGVVHRGLLHWNKSVAVKIPTEDSSVESFKTMLAEIKILCYMGSHPYIVCFLGAYTKEIEYGTVFIVTEYCENGSLETYLRKNNKTLDTQQYIRATAYQVDVYSNANYVGISAYETFQTNDDESTEFSIDLGQLRKFCYEIVLGMEYISKKKIVHSDLSTRNVLLTKNNTCKICDFGLARKLYSYKYMKKGGEAMPWPWMAIESLRNMEFTVKSDVWSYGVTMWEIFSLGEVPYAGVSWSTGFCENLDTGLRLQKPQYSSDAEYQVMESCWRKFPKDRLCFSDLISFWEQNK